MKQSIKIDPRFKGINHYEDYLILKHKRELKLFLFENDFPTPAKNKIWRIYLRRVTRENIKGIYTHPIMEFLKHLINGTLKELETYTSITNLN